MNEKELLAKLEQIKQAMEASLAKMKTETDPVKSKAYEDEIAAKSVEFETVRKTLETVRLATKSAYVLSQLRAEATADTTGANLNPANPPSERADGQGGFNHMDTSQSQAKDLFDKRRFFYKYLDCKSILSDNERIAISAVKANQRFSALGEGAVLLPRDISQAIITANYRGKSILSTDATGYSTDSGVANLRPETLFIPEVIRTPVVIPSLFDKTRRVPAGDGKVTYPILSASAGPFGGVGFTWQAVEGTTKDETKPYFGSWEQTTHELSGYTSISIMALRRSHIELEPFIIELFGNAVRYELSKRVWSGNGTTQPKGITVDTSTIKVARQLANEVGYVDLVALKYAVSQGYRIGAGFWLCDGVEQNLQEKVDKQDRPLFANDVASPQRDRLIGFPYDVQNYVLADPVEATAAGGAVSDVMNDLGDTGDIAFFNPQLYGCGVEMDIAIARSEHVQFLQGKVVIRLMLFVGGSLMLPAGVALLTNPV